jgi:phage tail-like protein
MRGTLPDLESPVPLVTLLPSIYQDDLFTHRFTAGFDTVLAPVFASLDCIDAYIDPWLCPDDFLDWLAGWVGLVLDEDWPVERQRAFIANAVQLYRWRGTVEGLRAELAIYTGGSVEISETGGTVWSPRPGGRFPGEEVPRMAVRITVDDPASVNQRRLDAMIAAAKPAHVVHTAEVVGR